MRYYSSLPISLKSTSRFTGSESCNPKKWSALHSVKFFLITYIPLLNHVLFLRLVSRALAVVGGLRPIDGGEDVALGAVGGRGRRLAHLLQRVGDGGRVRGRRPGEHGVQDVVKPVHLYINQLVSDTFK